LNIKSENNDSKHVGGLIMMHWQQTNKRAKSVGGEYLRSCEQENVTWYNLVVEPPPTNNHTQPHRGVAMLTRTAELLHCSGIT